MRFTRRLLVAGSVIAATPLVLLSLPARAAMAPPPPYAPVPEPGTGALTGMRTELAPTDSAMPPGVVNGPCQPSAGHPYPVVLVHGTFANENFSWQTLAPMLSDAGYCVFGLNYGATAWTTYSSDHEYGVDYVEHSAAQLQHFIQSTVLPDTVEPSANAAGYPAGSNPAQVDIVGHSQGGMMPRYMIDTTSSPRYPGLGAAAMVHTLVGLAPSNQGTTLGGMVTLDEALAQASGNPSAPYAYGTFGGDCGACAEQEAGSPFLQALNGQPDAAGVDYYVVESNRDEVVTPYTNAFLPSSENVENVTVQDQCPTDGTEHVGIIYDPVALQDVMAALADNGSTVTPVSQPSCPPMVAPVISG